MSQQQSEQISHSHRDSESQQGIGENEEVGIEAVQLRPIEEIVEPSTSSRHVTVRRGHPAHPKNRKKLRVVDESDDSELSFGHLVDAPNVTVRRKNPKSRR